jgi:hypothetical protein
LDDSARPLIGFLDEGVAVKDRRTEEEVWVGGSIGVDERSLAEVGWVETDQNQTIFGW